MAILKYVFAFLYSHYLALASKGYSAMSNKELALLTGFKKALFEDHGRAPIILTGLDLSAMNTIFPTGTLMKVTTQPQMRKTALTHLKKKKKVYEKKQIYKDFSKTFPSLMQSI